MLHSKGFAVRSTALAALFVAAMVTPALAQQPTETGLGSHFPVDAKDVSVVPGLHVYRWIVDGVKYIQVNDAAGNVLTALATANGQIVKLPMGTQARHLIVITSSVAATSDAGATVYNDGSVKITASSNSTGNVTFQAAASAGCGFKCGGFLPAIVQ